MLLGACTFGSIACLTLLGLSIMVAAVVDRSEELGPTADCVPKEPLIASWKTLQLNCTLNRTGLPVDRITCKFGTELLQTTVVDDRTFQVTKENVTRQMSHGHVFCHANVSGKQLQIAQVVIRVADIPTPPRITGCVVYNWERMVCTWEESPDTGLQTNYTLGWSVFLGSSCNGPYYVCPHPKANTCTWRKSDGQNSLLEVPYCLKTTARSQLANVSSSHLFSASDIVMPNPVTSITVSSVTNVSAALRWTWLDPSGTQRELIFKISYNSEWDTEYSTEETTYRNITLTRLLPFTYYSVTIECKYYPNGEHKGFWSNKTSISFRTAESVPSLAPLITPGGYLVRSADNRERIVDVFWQPLHQKFLQGRLFRYRLRYFDANDGRLVRDGFAYASRHVPYFHRAHLPLDLDIGVTVEAETTVGRNASLELDVILIPRADIALPKPDIYYAIGYNSEIVVGWSTVSNASGYTVYWCHIEPSGECETSLSWKHLLLNVTNLTIAIGDSKFREFSVAVSVETRDYMQRAVSSGMIETECVHDGTKDVLTPEGFRKSVYQQAFGFTVEWEKPNCHKTAFIFGYELLYCEKEACDDKICCKENQTLDVANSKTKFTITHLKADVEYEAWIRSRALSGVSQFSSPVLHFVFRSGLTIGVIGGIVAAAVLLLILMTVGLVAIVKKMNKNFCGKIEIIPPPPRKVTVDPNSNEQVTSSVGYDCGISVVMDGRNGEAIMLLMENSTSENVLMEKKPLRSNGNIKHLGEEQIQPFVRGDLEVEDASDMEVQAPVYSSISPYTHVAFPEMITPDKIADSTELRSPSFDTDSCAPSVIRPALCVVPLAEAKIAESTLESRTSEGDIPVSRNSLSTIAPYTTIEQIGEPDILRLTVNPDGRSDINPKAPDYLLCQNGVTEVGDETSVSSGRVVACGCIDAVTDCQMAYSNQREFPDDDIFSEYVDGTVMCPFGNPPLPVSYIPLAPTLST